MKQSATTVIAVVPSGRAAASESDRLAGFPFLQCDCDCGIEVKF